MAEIGAQPAGNLAVVTMEQMREVDRIMIEDLRIELMQMMENAGRNLARLAMQLYHPERVIVFAGSGGNGGGGLVAARHLANWGVAVAVVLGQPSERMSEVAGHQLDVLHRMRVPLLENPEGSVDAAIDALIGYSLRGRPSGRPAELITNINGLGAPVLSLDTPSGLDVTSGEASYPCVSATATMTLAAPKTGLLDAPEVGELYLADISVPPHVYEAFDLTMPRHVFRDGPIVRVA